LALFNFQTQIHIQPERQLFLFLLFLEINGVFARELTKFTYILHSLTKWAHENTL